MLYPVPAVIVGGLLCVATFLQALGNGYGCERDKAGIGFHR